MAAVIADAHIEDIEAAVDRSRWILTLTPDWDGEGAPAFERRTWETATHFLIENAKQLIDRYGKHIEVPKVLPGPRGSIDIHWKTKSFELLINFPAGSDRPATFYGDDYGSIVIKGTIDPKSVNPGMLIWLAKVV